MGCLTIVREVQISHVKD